MWQLDDIRPVDPDAGCGSPDEDGDCLSDPDDNCPGIANPSQANDREGAMHDSVGDVCDPQPTKAVDMRLAFFGFNDPIADSVAWILPSDGKWTFEQGYAEHTDVTDAVSRLLHGEKQLQDDISIEAGFT